MAQPAYGALSRFLAVFTRSGTTARCIFSLDQAGAQVGLGLIVLSAPATGAHPAMSRDALWPCLLWASGAPQDPIFQMGE